MLPSKKAIYVGLCGVGGLALVLDRFVLSSGGPEPALGATEVIPQASADAPIPAPAAATLPQKPGDSAAAVIPQKPFPRGVIPWDPKTEMRDLFAPLSEESPDDSAYNSGARAEAKRRAGRARFVQAHHLNGVITQPRLKIAVIDGRWVQVGDQIDGCTLTRIEGTAVSFACHDGETVLAMTGISRTSAD